MLGLVALLAALAQGIVHGLGAPTLWFRAWLVMLVFVVVGLATGALAAWVVDDAVASRVAAELAAAEKAAAAGAGAKKKGSP